MPGLTLMEDLSPDLKLKGQRLFDLIAQMGSLVVAYSGGVDSSLLCAVGYQALGDRLLAVTVHSPLEEPGDCESAAAFARQVGFRQRVIDFNDLANPQFTANPADRCYHCKLARFKEIQIIAAEAGAAYIAEGSNVDDASDYRPGSRAVAELGIRSPLAEAGFSKAEIRALARSLGLSVWNRPSGPCLATRFPYGTPVTLQGLKQIARGERFLHEKGFQPSRVRYYGKMARLEVSPDAIERLVAERQEVLMFFKNIGFSYVVADLAGYRSGSMNEVLQP